MIGVFFQNNVSVLHPLFILLRLVAVDNNSENILLLLRQSSLHSIRCWCHIATVGRLPDVINSDVIKQQGKFRNGFEKRLRSTQLSLLFLWRNIEFYVSPASSLLHSPQSTVESTVSRRWSCTVPYRTEPDTVRSLEGSVPLLSAVPVPQITSIYKSFLSIRQINIISDQSICSTLVAPDSRIFKMAEEFIDLQRTLYQDLASKYEVLGSLYSSKWAKQIEVSPFYLPACCLLSWHCWQQRNSQLSRTNFSLGFGINCLLV